MTLLDDLEEEEAEQEAGNASDGAYAADLLRRAIAEVERLQALASELLENKGRLEQMEKDFQPGLPERRLADDLLDAIQAFDAAEAAKEEEE